jgi:hypothetical protein
MICLLKHILVIEIHRHVEKSVNKHVDNYRKSAIATNLYLIAYESGSK